MNKNHIKEPILARNMPNTFWGITTFFNPVGYKNKYENYRIFRENTKRQGLKLLAVEITFGNKPFRLQKGYDADILIQIQGDRNNIMWQKERMLNIGLQNLPKDCDKIAWLDCDIIFKNDNWIKETYELLDKYTVVQLFEWAMKLPKGSIDGDFNKATIGKMEGQKDVGVVSNFLNTDAIKKFNGQPGYAWAARKNIFEDIGFFDKSILGGGDYIMIRGFLDSNIKIPDYYSDEMNCDVERWVKNMYERTNSNIYFTQGQILHLWHGQIDNRKYHSRLFLFKRAGFNPNKDIKIDNQGLYSWTENNKKFRKTVRAYFYARKEDVGFLNWIYCLIFKLSFSFYYKDPSLLFSDRRVSIYKKFMSKINFNIHTYKEAIQKKAIFLFLVIINVIFLFLSVFHYLGFIYFLIILCFSILITSIIEMYLRIQHNIDDKIKNFERSSMLKFNTVDKDITTINNLTKNAFSKLYNAIMSSSEYKKIAVIDYAKKINIKKLNNRVFPQHRSGWAYALDSLSPLHTDNGALLLGFIDAKFGWGNEPGESWNNPKPILEPWVGFFHSAVEYPNYKKYSRHMDKKSILHSDQWLASEKYCKGIFCLSKYQKDWLEKITTIPVEILLHPTEQTNIHFDFDSFEKNKDRKLIQIGITLRKVTSIYVIKPHIKRAVLKVTNEASLEQEANLLGLSIDYSSVEEISYLSEEDYDALLSKNIVFLDLWDTAASNTIIECIIRNTPVLVNPLPAVIEYLGIDYPFYFSNLEEAEKKADDYELIKKTNEYLKNLPIKEKLTGDYFLKSFAESEIYKNLPNL